MAKKRKRKRRVGFKNWKTLLGAISVIIFLFYFRNEVYRFSFKTYRWYLQLTYHPTIKHGLIEYPKGFSIHGIDVSKWQDRIDWKLLKAISSENDTIHFRFAFIKATEGILLEDPMFKDNWRNAKENKVIRGAYHYFLPTNNPKFQAANFIRNVEIRKGDLPPVVDIEETNGKSKREIIRQLKIYIKELEKHYKVRPIIYSNINFIENYLADDFKNYFFWIAHYYIDKLVVEDDINWIFWQHSDKAILVGSGWNVDVNVFNGGSRDLESILHK